ncbi:MAG: transcriptional regulator [Candidatus Syntrophonatronum acetioxidans]|uniref:Transcriptional regulator n=1 Tax=Candidatus Syntrophonatronum acetioxidans TaxID=1795816 RepID=A0A424YDL3_9FIRM|nr:MAG: transcriptional regulator [Candidatus Syntrophonatronum acetioxidans]
MDLTERQSKIIDIVKENGPISGEDIATRLNLSRAALRPHLGVLTMAGLLEARPKVGYYYAGKNANSLMAKTLRKIKVREIKGLPVVVKEDTSVYDAIVLLFLEDVGTLFIVEEGGFLAGIVSRKDFLKGCMGGADLQKMPVGVIMTRMPNVICVDPEDSVLDAAMKIMEYQIDSLPVVRKEKEGLKVVGRITKTNLTKLLVELGGEA